MSELNEETHGRIKELCAKGDALVEQKQFESALTCYKDALGIVPEPLEDWQATTWILTAIGDLYFFAQDMDQALTAFEDAVRCVGGLGNPFIHLRLGECYFELGKTDRAADELTRAYMGAGREIFGSEDPKYLKFLATRIVPPVGQDEL
ncbi:MAG TPA: tetratricopeptide repeat protein [Candidatus Angelobacter sp.]|nr:tetratricopeptide repeat protein [Candidatus Angelobacter sp.]